jgi:hypothetical protein
MLPLYLSLKSPNWSPKQHAIALRHVRDPRTLGAARPLGPVLLHQNGVDVTAHWKPERLQVLLSDLLLIRCAVADIEYFDAVRIGVLGELDRAWDRLGLFGLGPFVPGFRVEVGTSDDQTRLVGGIVDRRLVEIEDHRRRHVLITAGLVGCRPGLVGERLVEPKLGQRVDGEAVCPVFDCRLHPEFGIKQVVLWSGFCSYGRWQYEIRQRRSHDQAAAGTIKIHVDLLLMLSRSE